MTSTAKIFMNGASQAVRLPKEFRFESDEVCIKRVGSIIVLYEKDHGWDILRESAGQVSEDFMPYGRDQGGTAENREQL